MGIKLLQVRSFILLVFLAGCDLCGPQPQPQLAKSQFFVKCSDWPAIIDRCVPDKDTVVGNRAPDSLSATYGRRIHHYTSYYLEVRATPEGVGKLGESLKAEVHKIAQQLGVQIDEEGEGKASGGNFVSYDCEYTSENAHGQVKISVHDGKSEPGKTGSRTYSLTTKIEEWVP
jgi:hypothetical protein